MRSLGNENKKWCTSGEHKIYTRYVYIYIYLSNDGNDVSCEFDEFAVETSYLKEPDRAGGGYLNQVKIKTVGKKTP